MAGERHVPAEPASGPGVVGEVASEGEELCEPPKSPSMPAGDSRSSPSDDIKPSDTSQDLGTPKKRNLNQSYS